MNSALKRFEAAADSAFASLPPPHPNAYVSAWYFLIVSEDAQRLLFLDQSSSLTDWQIEYVVDRYKFSLRHCIAAIGRRCPDKSSLRLPDRIVPELYVRARRLLEAGIEYSVAAQICASAHSGSASVVEEGDGFAVNVDERLTDRRYGALELMRQSAGEQIVPFYTLLWFWIRHAEEVPTAVYRIAESSRLSRRRIQYNFDAELSYRLAQNLHQLPFEIPDEWKFPWGGRLETTLLLNALSLRLVYHLSAVHFGAVRFQLKGGAEADICFTTTTDQIVHDIALNSSLDLEKIRVFVEYLTYGRGVESPDQALQPFVPLGAQRLGVAGIGFLSSNAERNLLTLQARVEPRLFDSQSALFEARMTSHLQSEFARKWRRVASNLTVSLGAKSEEFDLLVCEPETRTVLVLEFRWMLSPADPREVQSKKRTCYEKVIQVERKISAATRELNTLLRVAFNLSHGPSQDWKVYGAVIIQGFGAALSQMDSIPVMPDWVVEAGVRGASSLRHLADWMQSLAWLPIEGRDFERAEDFSLLEMKVRRSGIKPVRPGREYLEDVVRALSRD